ncbi:MAG: helix-turn-helix domain-containing protein [Propionibacteriaceae bacterium]
MTSATTPNILLREQLGETLRAVRLGQHKTLRQVSRESRVSLGYLSEVERGQKEASSELLAAICGALNVPLSSVLCTVADRIAAYENIASLPQRNTRVASAA